MSYTRSHIAKAGVLPVERPEPKPKVLKLLKAKPRAKGNRAEREVIDILRSRGYRNARRNWQSGGQGGADIIEAIPGYSLEVKHRETVAVWPWIAQAAEAAAPTETPVVVHRTNHRDWHAILPHQDLQSLLQLNGNPATHTLVRETGRLQLWSLIDRVEERAVRCIPVVEFARPGADSGWYCDLRFLTLLDLIAEAQA